MVESHMMTEEQQKHVLEWIRARITKPCPLCGCGLFSVTPTVFRLEECRVPGAHMMILPAVLICCDSCAHVMIFSAKMMKLPGHTGD
jgi:hypothetical protein